MSTTLNRPEAGAASGTAGVRSARRGRWIEHWEPEDEAFWESTGKAIARRNLRWSVFAEHIGFCIWVIWTIVVINLANVGIVLSVPEQFWLTAVPNLIGSALRIPPTLPLPPFRGRGGATTHAPLLLPPPRPPALLVAPGRVPAPGPSTP